MWRAGSVQEAVLPQPGPSTRVSSRSSTATTLADPRLCREAFGLGRPSPGQPRLRFPGNRASGHGAAARTGYSIGARCFEGIHDVSAHMNGLELTDQVALDGSRGSASWLGRSISPKAKMPSRRAIRVVRIQFCTNRHEP